MKIPRRMVLSLAAGAAAAATARRIANAQAYPTRPIRWVVGYPAGGGTDIFVRLISQPLSERLGQSFVIENRPGAASNIATEAVARAPADGYTLLGTDGAAAINATLYGKLNFNFEQDFAVVGMVRSPLVILLHPSVPVRTVPELITYAKANPRKLTMGSAGTGNPTHLAGELFKFVTATEMTHVPYRGAAPALTDLLGGQVQVMFGGVPAAIEHIRTGKLRAIAVTSVTPFDALPTLPPVATFVPGYEASQWYCVALRRSAPAAVTDKLNAEINAILQERSMTTRLVDLGGEPMLLTPAEFDRFVVVETEKWANVIR